MKNPAKVYKRAKTIQNLIKYLLFFRMRSMGGTVGILSNIESFNRILKRVCLSSLKKMVLTLQECKEVDFEATCYSLWKMF